MYPVQIQSCWLISFYRMAEPITSKESCVSSRSLMSLPIQLVYDCLPSSDCAISDYRSCLHRLLRGGRSSSINMRSPEWPAAHLYTALFSNQDLSRLESYDLCMIYIHKMIQFMRRISPRVESTKLPNLVVDLVPKPLVDQTHQLVHGRASDVLLAVYRLTRYRCIEGSPTQISYSCPSLG
jgi:hypothetical protein